MKPHKENLSQRPRSSFEAKLPPDGFQAVVLKVWGGLDEDLQGGIAALGGLSILESLKRKRKKGKESLRP